MRTVFVNRFYAPDHSATSQLLTDLAASLAAGGADVHVVASCQLYDDTTARLPAHEIIDGVSVHRVRCLRFGRGRLAGRALGCLGFYLAAALLLLRLLRDGDVVVAKTDPPLVSVPVHWAAWLRGARLVNWLQDLFPEVAAEVGVALGRGPAGRMLRWVRNRSLHAAAVNVVLGQTMRDRVEAQGVDPQKIAVIPNWADGSVIRPLDAGSNPLRSAWGLDGKFVVGYSGNLGRVHESETILGAVRALRDRRDIVFLFIGGGVRMADIAAVAQRERLANLQFRPYQPRERLSQSLGAVDLHLVSLRPALEGLCVPSKIYGIGAVGRPTVFVGDAAGEVAGLIRSAGSGCSVAEGDVSGLVASITELAADAGRCAEMGSAARRAFDESYDRPASLLKWRMALDAAGRTEPSARRPARVQAS